MIANIVFQHLLHGHIAVNSLISRLVMKIKGIILEIIPLNDIYYYYPLLIYFFLWEKDLLKVARCFSQIYLKHVILVLPSGTTA